MDRGFTMSLSVECRNAPIMPPFVMVNLIVVRLLICDLVAHLLTALLSYCPC